MVAGALASAGLCRLLAFVIVMLGEKQKKIHTQDVPVVSATMIGFSSPPKRYAVEVLGEWYHASLVDWAPSDVGSFRTGISKRCTNTNGCLLPGVSFSGWGRFVSLSIRCRHGCAVLDQSTAPPDGSTSILLCSIERC